MRPPAGEGAHPGRHQRAGQGQRLCRQRVGSPRPLRPLQASAGARERCQQSVGPRAPACAQRGASAGPARGGRGPRGPGGRAPARPAPGAGATSWGGRRRPRTAGGVCAGAPAASPTPRPAGAAWRRPCGLRGGGGCGWLRACRTARWLSCSPADARAAALWQAQAPCLPRLPRLPAGPAQGLGWRHAAQALGPQQGPGL
jgi:hypothetical protein